MKVRLHLRPKICCQVFTENMLEFRCGYVEQTVHCEMDGIQNFDDLPVSGAFTRFSQTIDGLRDEVLQQLFLLRVGQIISTVIRAFQSSWMLYDSTKSKQDQESTHRTIQPSCDLFHGGTMGSEEAQYCITC